MVDPPHTSARPQPTSASAPPLPRIALAHDWLVGFRGGEAVLESIARTVTGRAAPAGLYTMFARPGPLFGEDRGSARKSALAPFGPPRSSWLNGLPGARGPLRRWLLPLYPSAVAQLSRRLARDHAQAPVDLLISTSSAAIKGLRPPVGVSHLCYCHSPARYLWSQTTEYGRGQAGGLRTLGLNTFGARLRAWDRRTAAHVTRFLANSTHTAAEIRRCYGRDADVVFPPVDTEFFTPDESLPRGEHWLYAGALEPYKRVDLLIHAANRARHPLTIVGDGSQSSHLRSLAGPTITFRGRVDDDALRHEYRTARLVAFPQIEDFGIVAVEAQACGTPVLAFRAGGALDTVSEGVTGTYFNEASPDAFIAAAALTPEPTAATRTACRANAQRFGECCFAAAMNTQIDSLLSRAR